MEIGVDIGPDHFIASEWNFSLLTNIKGYIVIYIHDLNETCSNSSILSNYTCLIVSISKQKHFIIKEKDFELFFIFTMILCGLQMMLHYSFILH